MATNAIVAVKNGNLDFALKDFKRKMKNYKVLEEFELHREFEKPSAKKRRKHIASIRRNAYETEELKAQEKNILTQ